MSNQRIKIDELGQALADALKEYNQQVNEALKAGCKAVGKEAARVLRSTSPKRTGEYAKGWTQKTSYETADNIRVTVYNNKKPQLAHLLEYGHAKVNGGRVEGKAHIRPAEERAEKQLLGRVKVRM